jgi:hypothetical protein
MRSSATRQLAVFSLVSIIATTAAQAGADPAPAPAPPRVPAVDETADACFGAAERAQPLLRQKRFREARALLEVCARDVCPHSARSDCREWLAEAIDAQSSIVISAHEVRGEGETRSVREVHGVRAVIDEVLVIDDADQTPIAIDPGQHRLRLERPGADAQVQDINVREGEKSRIVDVYWEIPVVVGSRPVPASVYVIGAIGVVAMGVGAYFEITGFSQRHELDTTCKAAQTCTQTQVDLARAQIGVGDATLGGGLLFLAGAAFLYFTRPMTDTTPMKGRTAWTFDVAPLGLPGLGWQGVGRRGDRDAGVSLAAGPGMGGLASSGLAAAFLAGRVLGSHDGVRRATRDGLLGTGLFVGVGGPW